MYVLPLGFIDQHSYVTGKSRLISPGFRIKFYIDVFTTLLAEAWLLAATVNTL